MTHKFEFRMVVNGETIAEGRTSEAILIAFQTAFVDFIQPNSLSPGLVQYIKIHELGIGELTHWTARSDAGKVCTFHIERIE